MQEDETLVTLVRGTHALEGFSPKDGQEQHSTSPALAQSVLKPLAKASLASVQSAATGSIKNLAHLNSGPAHKHVTHSSSVLHGTYSGSDLRQRELCGTVLVSVHARERAAGKEMGWQALPSSVLNLLCSLKQVTRPLRGQFPQTENPWMDYKK